MKPNNTGITYHKANNTWYIEIPESELSNFMIRIREGKYVYKRIKSEIIAWLNENTPIYEADDSANEILFEFKTEEDAMAFILTWC